MKKTILVVAVLLAASAAQAYMLDDCEDPYTTWTAYTGGAFTTIENSTDDPYVGNRSLKIVDTDSAYPYIQLTTNHGDLSASKGEFLELAVKFDSPACGWLGMNGMDVYLGNDSDNRVCWRVRETDIQGLAVSDPPADGWYVFHLELDNGNSTLIGSTINGVAVSDGTAWTMGMVDWTQIDFMAILIFQASASDVFEQYIDHIYIYEMPDFCGDTGTIYFDADISGPSDESDCYVDFYDFAAMAEVWLGCTDPENPDCFEIYGKTEVNKIIIEIEAEDIGPIIPPMILTMYEHASGGASVYFKNQPFTWQPNVSEQGTYHLWVRARSGWTGNKYLLSQPGILNAKLGSDDIELTYLEQTLDYYGDGENFAWVKSEPLNLDAGVCVLNFTCGWEWLHVDKLVLATEGSFEPSIGNIQRNEELAGKLSVWTASPYTMFSDDLEPPAQADGSSIDLVVPRGGTAYGGFFIRVDETSPISVPLRFTVYSLKNSQSSFPHGNVTLHQVTWTGMREGAELAADALPMVNRLGYQRIPPGMTNLYWVMVRAPEDIAPGDYSTSIGLENQINLKGQGISLNVKVSEVVLPEQNNLAIFNWWGYYDNWWGDADKLTCWWEDEIAHGINSFKVIPYREIKFQFDADGNLIGGMDFSCLVSHITAINETGGYLLLEWDQGSKNLDGLQCSSPGAPAGADLSFMSEPWKRAFETLITQTTAYLVSQGISKEHVLQYIYDEYLGEDFINVGGLIRSWDPELMIFADLSASIEVYEAAAPYVDIWCPFRSDIPAMAEDGRLELMRSTGQVWTYSAGYLQRAFDPYAEFRYPFWLTYRYELDGCTYWKHLGDRVGTAYYPMDVESGITPVTSRRWEAWYSGVQDYKLLKMLEAIAEGGGPGAGDAMSILQNAVTEVTDNPDDELQAEEQRRIIIEFLENN
ncbi:MAG: hypothetical protein ABIG61_07090 [Planctomycetota bacterium]